MGFEARLLIKHKYREHKNCLALIEANGKYAPAWERMCLALYVSIGPPLARLFGVDTGENWRRAEKILEEIFAVTGMGPDEIARLLRRYIKLRNHADHHLPFEQARDEVYNQIFYPIVTHFTYAIQPSATARLNFVREVVNFMWLDCARVGDLGCGSGVLLTEILAMKPRWLGHGLDVSSASINYAQALAEHKGVADRASFLTGDIESLPYEDHSLDLVVASEVIEHMPRPERVVSEIARVLRRRGKLVLTMPLESSTPCHIHALSDGEALRSLCEESGLRIERMEPRWHFGFGDDRRHVFVLAEASDGREVVPRYSAPAVVRGYPSVPEPEAV